jgi:APA family basic amino acid/polyamine antiporter
MSMERKKLGGGISLIGFFSLAFGSMIGVGWVTGIGSWFVSAGPLGAVIAFGLAAIFMSLIGLCYAEVTSAIPVASGEVAYAYKAFGVSKSFMIGWCLH